MQRDRSGTSDLPLEGLRVVELGGVAAAYAAKMFADFGADVATLLPSEGDPLRWGSVEEALHDESSGPSIMRFLRTNRSFVAGPFDQALTSRLLGRAGVLITDVPDAIRRHAGLSTDAVRREHPHLVVVTITPFGSDGPFADGGCSELVMYAEGGLAQLTPGLPDGAEDPYVEGPLHPGGYPASIIVGLTAAVAALAALPQRRGGPWRSGQHIDVSGQAAVASMASRYLAVSSYEEVVADRSYPGPLNMPNLYLPCRDGYVVIAAILDAQWIRLVEALGSPDWALDDRYARAAGRNRDRQAIEARLREWCLARDGEEIVRRATEAGVPCFRFYRLDEMESSEHVIARGSLVGVPGLDGRSMPGAPFLMSRSAWRSPRTEDPARALDQLLESPDWSDGPQGQEEDEEPTPAPASRGPLEGIRVLDFGQVLAVPFGTQWMSWLGADVILVESAAHPHTRATPPFSGERDPNASAVFNFFNGGKRSLTVDLKSDEGRQLLLDLVPHCDVITENFRAGVLDRMGLSFARVRELREDIIVLSLGAFGRSGPMADAAGLHSAANLFSGLADVTRYPGGRPRIMGGVLPDPLSGLNGLLAVLLALQHRRRTGEGQWIDQAMYETLLPLCAGAIMADESQRAMMRSRGGQGGGMLFGGFFPGRDRGEWLALEVRSIEQWGALAALIGLDAVIDARDPTDSFVAHHARAAVTSWLTGRPLDDAIDELRRSRIPAGRSRTTLDILGDPNLRRSGYLHQVDHPSVGPRWIPTLPWSTDRPSPTRPGRAPMLGEHVEEILGGLLGRTSDEVERLRGAGVLT